LVSDCFNLRQLFRIFYFSPLLRSQRRFFLNSFHLRKYFSPHSKIVSQSDKSSAKMPSGLYFHNNLFALLKYSFSSWSSFRQLVKQRNNFLRYFSREKLTNDELYETRKAIQAKYYFLRYFFHGKVAQGWILKTYKATNTLLLIFEKYIFYGFSKITTCFKDKQIYTRMLQTSKQIYLISW
jgi:hypothetical protein